MTLFRNRIRNPLPLLCLYTTAIGAGYLSSIAHVPLPWMVGPMLLSIVVALSKARIEVPLITRTVGQGIVGITVGTFMTPAALRVIGDQFVTMLAAVAFTVMAGLVAAAVQMRLSKLDSVSANLASIPGGPVEMATLAQRYGVDPGPVVFAQILRIVLLVILIPTALTVFGNGSANPSAPATAELGAAGTAFLLLAGFGGGLVFQHFGANNPFFLGSLLTIAAIWATAPLAGGLPQWMVASAQVLLGVWLGCTFDRALLRNARRMVPAMLVSTGVLLTLCAVMAMILSSLAGIGWKTMVLATAPGSVTEMALTAQVLGEGVALVTAFHLTRIFITLPLVPVTFRLVLWLVQRRRDKKSDSGDQQ